MLPASTLLVSRHPQLIRTIQKAHDSCDLLRLEICGVLDKAPLRLKADDVALVLIHIASDSDSEQLRHFGEASACQEASIVLICNDENSATEGRCLLQQGAADLLCLPEDSGKLVHLMDTANRRARGTENTEPIHMVEEVQEEPVTIGFFEAEYLGKFDG